jgi:ferric-dicitrate binding protein FerR (iron transport regulator)
MENGTRDYRNFSAQDLALDASFLKWVLSPDDESTRFWNGLIQRYPHLEKEVMEAQELIRLTGLSADPEANAAYLNTWTKLRENAEPSRARTFVTPVYARLAAVFIGLIVMVSYLVWNSRKTDDLPEFQTAYGEIKEVELKDGSKVTLNSNSSLKYTTAFDGTREVLLKGEAFFEVSKTHDGQKFIIHTQEPLDIEVLGTEFNVNTRHDKIMVFLQTGIVDVRSAASHVTLSPGEQAHYSRGTQELGVTKQSTSAAEGVLGWTSRLFVYNDASLSVIAEEIEDYYGVPVAMTDPALGQRKFTGKIPRQHVEVLLKVLSETLEIAIERKENQIIIRPMDG